jgi:hypothetical protein
MLVATGAAFGAFALSLLVQLPRPADAAAKLDVFIERD